jgi:hypothetical protein
MPANSNETRSNGARMARRYGPIVGVLVVIVVIAIIASTSGGGGGTKKTGGGSQSNDALTKAGPLTPARAKLEGKTVAFGPNCDTARGRVKIPFTYAAPCVQPFTGDNGGATSPGVTADSITVAVYTADPKIDPLQSSLIAGAGANTDEAAIQRTYQGYSDLFEKYYEMYGRKVKLVYFTGTGKGDDETAAKADAIKIATDIKPFAVWGGPNRTPAFYDELAARHILCVDTCALAAPEQYVLDHQPYIWGTGPTPEQSAQLTVEMISKEFKGKAEHAGDPSLQKKDRVFGVAHYNTPQGQQTPAFNVLKDGLAKNGVHIKTDVEFPLDLPRAQENARTIITKFKEAGVTSIIYTGDPFTPGYLTKEATAQNYFPEWIIGPTVLVDIALFGRTYDQKQWAHAFGLSLVAARGDVQTTNENLNLYRWQYGKEPPSNTYGVIIPAANQFYLGVTLAGPKLTPEGYRDGLFRALVTGGGPTKAQVSRGFHGVWPGKGPDIGGSDDATLIWWNPDVSGEDEVGHQGKGLYEYANGGTRYTPGHWPATPVGLFDASNSVTIFKEIPPQDQVPSYPSPAG